MAVKVQSQCQRLAASGLQILLLQPLLQFLSTQTPASDPFPLKIHSAFLFSAINLNCYSVSVN